MLKSQTEYLHQRWTSLVYVKVVYRQIVLIAKLLQLPLNCTQ